MPQVSIRFRLTLTLLLLIGTGGMTQVASYLLAHDGTSTLQERSGELLQFRDLSHEVHEIADRQHEAVLLYLLTEDPKDAFAYAAARTDEVGLLAAWAAAVAEYPEVASALDAVRQATDKWRTESADPSIALVESDRAPEARSLARIRSDDRLFEAVLEADAGFDAAVGRLDALTLVETERMEANHSTLVVLNGVAQLVGTLVAIWLLSRWILRPLGALLVTARRVEAGDDVAFRADGNDEIDQLGQALEHMRFGLWGQATEASVVNRFTELTAFVESEGDVARATLDALLELASPDDASIHISNRSKDRAIPEGSVGGIPTAVISLGQLAQCPGIRRGSMYVTTDLSDRLSVHCPIHPGLGGTMACLPLIALGEVVGVAHLHWAAVDGMGLDIRTPIARITEHASLAIANRRLMTALQGMATSDGRTGLPNSRAFDEALEETMNSRSDGQPLSVLMLDLDGFKQFNDRNGHPAGDQALRAFAGILRGAVRDGDMAARYGGEEFVVMLSGASSVAATVVAERIRALTEATVIELSPGHRDQITVSIGVAAWPVDATDRVKLLEVADAALYRAKNAGRNRVVVAGQAFEARADEGVQGPAGPVALHLAG